MKEVIIFDLDETIGYFSQIYIIILRLEELYKIKLSYSEYRKIFEKYENIFRPGIFVLFAYLNALKSKYDIKVILYTNTTLSDSFLDNIIKYLNERIHNQHNIFDDIITLRSSCRNGIKKQFSDIYNCLGYLNNGYVFLIIDNYNHSKLDKLYSKLIKVNNYNYKYLISDIWNGLHEKLMIEKKYNIVDKIIIDGDKNMKIYNKCKNDVLNLFSVINKFINIKYIK